jgi:hypothetical protein
MVVVGDFKEFQAEMAEFEHAGRLFMLAAAVRALLINLRVAMLQSTSRSEVRLEELRGSLQQYTDVEDKFFANRHADIRGMDSKWDFSGSKAEAMAKMSGQLTSIKNSLLTARTDLCKFLGHVAQQNSILAQFDERGVEIVVSVDKNGTIQKAYRNQPLLPA